MAKNLKKLNIDEVLDELDYMPDSDSGPEFEPDDDSDGDYEGNIDLPSSDDDSVHDVHALHTQPHRPTVGAAAGGVDSNSGHSDNDSVGLHDDDSDSDDGLVGNAAGPNRAGAGDAPPAARGRGRGRGGRGRGHIIHLNFIPEGKMALDIDRRREKHQIRSKNQFYFIYLCIIIQ